MTQSKDLSLQYSVPYKRPFWLFVSVKIMWGDCLKRRTLMNRPNNQTWWFIRLQRVSILCQPLAMVLMRLQNPVNHRRRNVQLTHQAMEDSHLFKLQRVDGDYLRGYHSHQDPYSVTMCVVHVLALAWQLAQMPAAAHSIPRTSELLLHDCVL